MSTESTIVVTVGALLLITTGTRFVLQELIAVVILYKKLKATIKAKYPLESDKDFRKLRPPSG